MIRDLLTPEAQPDPYVRAAVLLAHAGIGAALWALMMCGGRRPWRAVWLVLIVYGLFEMVQATVSGSFLIWDIALDWSAVGLGAALASALWDRSLAAARIAAAAVGIIAAVGAWRRR